MPTSTKGRQEPDLRLEVSAHQSQGLSGTATRARSQGVLDNAKDLSRAVEHNRHAAVPAADHRLSELAARGQGDSRRTTKLPRSRVVDEGDAEVLSGVEAGSLLVHLGGDTDTVEQGSQRGGEQIGLDRDEYSGRNGGVH